MIEEFQLTQEIDELIERRRQVFQCDPLGLTHRNSALLNNPLMFDDIQLSLETQTAIRGDRELKFTRQEFNLLHTFLQNPETALSRAKNVPNVTVKNLRAKLEAADESRVIHSLQSYGYVLKAVSV
jgi:DNA-binding response OmpR family regulator